ncbi:hypothetical protein NFI96_023982, partial [Prochilodus magdalenae]
MRSSRGKTCPVFPWPDRSAFCGLYLTFRLNFPAYLLLSAQLGLFQLSAVTGYETLCSQNSSAAHLPAQHSSVQPGDVMRSPVRRCAEICTLQPSAVSCYPPSLFLLNTHHCPFLCRSGLSSGLAAGSPGRVGSERLGERAIRPLQLVQNAAAHLIFNFLKFTHVTPLLRSLHWLPVVARIRFKTLMLAYKAKIGPAPPYLMAMVKSRAVPRALRASSTARLEPPSLRTHGRQASRLFSVLAPRWWNELSSRVSRGLQTQTEDPSLRNAHKNEHWAGVA